MMPSVPFLVVNVMGQFAVAVALAWLALRALRGASASLRHVVWLTVMLSPALLLCLSGTPARLSVLVPTPPAAAEQEPREAHTPRRDLQAVEERPTNADTDARQPSQPQAIAGETLKAPDARTAREPAPPTRVATPSTDSPPTPPAPGPSLMAIVFWAYLTGVALFTGWTVVGFARVRRIVRRAMDIGDDALDATTSQLAGQLGVRRRVRVLVSSDVAAPFCAGVFTPSILLPRDLLAYPDRVRMVIAHELAHIARHDHLWTALGAIVRVFCYCHPGFYVARWSYRLASEEMCDAAAVAVTGSRRAYVECLTDIARVSLGRYPLGFAEPRGTLARRAQEVLNGKGGTSMLRRRSLYAAGLAVALAILGLSGVRLVADASAAANTATSTRSVEPTAPAHEKWATRFRNLDAIHAGLTAFRQDTGDYPQWLSELHPRYIADASTFIDPFDLSEGHPDEGYTGLPTDPNMAVSYGYELSPRSVGDRSADDIHGILRRQLEEHGSYAPIVRVSFIRGLGALNLGVGGRLYLSSGTWQSLKLALDGEELQRDGGTLIFSMELNDAPAGYVTPSRLTRDVAAMIADFADDGGDSAGRYHAEGLLRAWNHDREGAARAMQQAVARKPDDIQILYHHARLLHQMGRHEEAIPAYEKIVASDRRVTRQWEETHRHLSELYVGANADSKHRKLIAGVEEYVTGGSRHLQGNLLRMYSRAGMFTEVTEKGDALLKVNANDSTVANLIADAHRELGNADEADRYHRLANPAYDLVGRKAPTFTLEDAQGVVYKSADISGPILLNLWWSGGFAEHGSQIAALEALHGKYADDGLVVLGGCVSTDMGGRARELGLVGGVATFPILFDGRTAYQAYSVKRTATFLIDSTGHIRYVTTDPDKDAADLEEAVLAMLAVVSATDGAGMRIAGVARDEHGAPVVNAAITLYMVDNVEAAHREVGRTVSGTDGAFDFGEHPLLDMSALEVGRHYQVIALADDQSLGLAYINGVTDDPGAVDLGFTRPTRVEGTVSDEAGEPIVGARVFIRSAMAKQAGDDSARGDHRLLLLSLYPGDVLSATTAADGRFTIERAPANTAGMLSVHHPDYARVHENYDASSGQQVAFVLPGAGTLTGRVYYADMLPGGSPDRALAPGVEVRVQSAMPAAVSRAAYRGGKGRDRHFGAGVSTDDQGRYRIEGVPPGYLNIWASADGYTCVAWDTYGITEGGVHEADLYLIKGGFIVGSVVDDETGKAVRPGERSDVGLYGPSKPISGAAIDYARIAEDGTFRLRAAPGANFPYLRSRPPWTVVGPLDRVRRHTVNVEDGKTVEVVFRVRREDAAQAN